MFYKPEIAYDAVSKVWSSRAEFDHFAPDLSIGEIIYREMQRHPQQIAQISVTERTELRRDELHLNSKAVASYMRQLGLLQTDIVGIVARNTTHLSAVAYGCFYMGIAFHSLNINYEQATISQLFNITKPRLLFCDGDEYEMLKAATKQLDCYIVTMRRHVAGVMSIEQVLQTPVPLDFKPAKLQQGNNQTLAILCTIGTPKAVTITNSRKILNGNLMLTTSDVQYSHRTLDCLTSLITTITTAVFSTKRIIADNAFDAEQTLRLIETYKVSWLLLAPAHFGSLVSSPLFERTSLDSVQHCMFTGGRCSLRVQQALRQRLSSDGMHFAYGMTEVGSWATLNWNFDEKPTSVGRPTAGFQLKIIDERNAARGPNELGEICLHNGQYWAGYFGDPQESQQLRDAAFWFHTGDLGYVDADGFLYVLDRNKEIVKHQNIMYYHNELEELIARMPQVADVCVFGIWSERNGDEPAAVVVKRAGAELQAAEVVAYVQQHVAAHYKQLIGGALIVDDLQRSPNGKINRAANKSHFLQVKGQIEKSN
ncbi:maker206 [Drosophila busckii]|uniref:Maker206 n=1 Tax=Drosophila busckii TaxID=30019 RepID=A0A0M4EPD5_DROBS|nr:luciferin 4-monooxygenase [Drosophila busckii]ALC46701.1 maker206 [Drosophila busckii]